MIKEYIEAKYGFKVHIAYIAEVRRSLGLPMYDAPNVIEELKQPTTEKAEAIKDSSPGRAVVDAGLNDPAFIKSNMKILIRRSHKRYPSRSQRGIRIRTKMMIRAGRVNATCSSWRLNAISAPLALRLLFHIRCFFSAHID